MIVSGLPEKNGALHVREISYVALSILQHVLTFKIPHKPEKQLEIRIGNILPFNYFNLFFFSKHLRNEDIFYCFSLRYEKKKKKTYYT